MEELNFVDVPVIRDNIDKSLGEVLGDIESRMPANHVYRDADRITWAHETTHGLNANIRIANFTSGRRINTFYVLDGKAIILDEPDFRLTKVASTIPSSLRGDIFDTYMIKQAKTWDDCPLYTFDEWVAYQNGAACRNDLKIEDRAETVRYMFEMAVYASYTLMLDDDPGYGPQRRAALKYMLDRSMVLYYSSSNQEETDAYLEKVKAETSLNNFWAQCNFNILKNV